MPHIGSSVIYGWSDQLTIQGGNIDGQAGGREGKKWVGGVIGGSKWKGDGDGGGMRGGKMISEVGSEVEQKPDL